MSEAVVRCWTTRAVCATWFRDYLHHECAPLKIIAADIDTRLSITKSAQRVDDHGNVNRPLQQSTGYWSQEPERSRTHRRARQPQSRNYALHACWTRDSPMESIASSLSRLARVKRQTQPQINAEAEWERHEGFRSGLLCSSSVVSAWTAWVSENTSLSRSWSIF
jgi:hypothetical protein